MIQIGVKEENRLLWWLKKNIKNLSSVVDRNKGGIFNIPDLVVTTPSGKVMTYNFNNLTNVASTATVGHFGEIAGGDECTQYTNPNDITDVVGYSVESNGSTYYLDSMGYNIDDETYSNTIVEGIYDGENRLLPYLYWYTGLGSANAEIITTMFLLFFDKISKIEVSIINNPIGNTVLELGDPVIGDITFNYKFYVNSNIIECDLRVHILENTTKSSSNERKPSVEIVSWNCNSANRIDLFMLESIGDIIGNNVGSCPVGELLALTTQQE